MQHFFICNLLLKLFPTYIPVIILIDPTLLLIYLYDDRSLSKILQILKNSSLLRFNVLLDSTATDDPVLKTRRFTLTYILVSPEHSFRLAIRCPVDSNHPLFHAASSSVHSVFVNASWSEREITDMFGIHFWENPDLRRLLSDYGFEGYPLRKDFPLSGYTEVRYSTKHSAIVYVPVELAQDYRIFSFASPWEEQSS